MGGGQGWGGFVLGGDCDVPGYSSVVEGKLGRRCGGELGVSVFCLYVPCVHLRIGAILLLILYRVRF